MLIQAEKLGYRAGIHMKEYKEKRPLIVIGGSAGSFLGRDEAEILDSPFTVVTADSKNPYKRLYVAN